MKHVWKRMTAIAMAAVLVAPIGVKLGNGASVVKAASPNLVVNGDFDTDGGVMDAAGWVVEKENKQYDTTEYFTDGGFDNATSAFTVSNAEQVITTDPLDGTNSCLQLKATSAGGYAGYDLRNLTAGETYNITFKIYVGTTAATDNIQALVIDRTASGPNSYHLLGGKHNSTSGTVVTAKNISDKGWVTYSCNITASENMSYWTLRIVLSNTTTTWYIDDISVKHVSEYAENGSFNTDTTGWTTNTESMVWGAATGNGNGGVAVTNTATEQWIRTYVPVTGGQSYHFSYWFQCTDSSNTRIYTSIIQRAADKATKTYDTDYAYTNNWVGTSATKDSYLIAGTLKPDATWRNVVGQFTTAAETVYAEVRIRICNATGTINFDDFSCTGLAVAGQDGVSLNGSDYAMKLSGDNSASYSGLTLTAGKKYNYSYEISADSTLSKALLTVGSQELSATSGVFTYADGAVGLKTAGTGTAYFDNISISEHTHVDTTPADEFCDTCSENLHQHTMSGWQNNGTEHWKECTKNNCDYKEDKGTCAGGTATCDAKAICTTCHLEHGSELGHQMSGWKNNGTEHWKECGRPGCLHKEDEGTCAGGTATCQTRATCTTCGLQHGTYAGCVDADRNELCDVCQADLHEHAYTKQVVNDATLKSAATTTSPAVYYKSCACGDISDTETFQYGSKLEVEEQKKEDDTSKAPVTGDSIPAIWLYVMVMTVGVIVFCVKKKIQEM